MARNSTKRLLILEAHSGGGHISISQAISHALEHYKNIEIIRVNAVPTTLKKIYEPITRQKSRTISEIYQLIYKLSDNPDTVDVIGKINVILNQHRFARFLHYYRPDAILSNAHWAVQDVPYILNKVYHRIPFLVFVADPFSVHSIWYSPLVDHTFVPTLHAYTQALTRGLQSSQVTLTGHPVRHQFIKPPHSDPKKLRKKLGLDPDLYTIYFGGSGEGIQKLIVLLKSLAQQSQPFQGLVLTGNNQKLKDEIDGLNLPNWIKIKTYGFLEDPSPYMHASDLVVGKAGPNLIFEAAMAGKPFFAIHHVKGQETGNIELIKHMQIGFIEENPLRASHLISYLLQHPQYHQAVKPGITALQAHNQEAAKKIAHITNEYITGNRALEVTWPPLSAFNQYLNETMGEFNDTVQLLASKVKKQPEINPLLREFKSQFTKLKQFLETEHS